MLARCVHESEDAEDSAPVEEGGACVVEIVVGLLLVVSMVVTRAGVPVVELVADKFGCVDIRGKPELTLQIVQDTHLFICDGASRDCATSQSLCLCMPP